MFPPGEVSQSSNGELEKKDIGLVQGKDSSNVSVEL